MSFALFSDAERDLSASHLRNWERQPGESEREREKKREREKRRRRERDRDFKKIER